jgi:hypothetical protein
LTICLISTAFPQKKGAIALTSMKTAHLDYHNLEDDRRAATLIRELGLEAYSFHAPFSQNLDISSMDESARMQAFHEITEVAEAASVLGVRHFFIHPGPEKLWNLAFYSTQK